MCTKSDDGESEAGLGVSKVGLGESEAGLGESEVGLGESKAGLGVSEVRLGESEVRPGESEVGLGVSEVRPGVIKDLTPHRNKSGTIGAFDVKPEKLYKISGIIACQFVTAR